MRILVTGSNGFLGTNLRHRLRETPEHTVDRACRDTPADALERMAATADFVFHLAGVNRPPDPRDFQTGNVDFTAALRAALARAGRPIPIVYASSTQAALDNPYGRSKKAAEDLLLGHGRATGSPVHICRLPNIFGKWCRPDYNSAVATFCHNLARGLPIRVDSHPAPLRLVHVDSVMEAFLALLAQPGRPGGPLPVAPVYETTVGEVAGLLLSFVGGRTSLAAPRAGTGLTRALYSTYVSYLEPDDFAYEVPVHRDPRGEFAEMLRTPDCGQFSYFTANPGATRGEHYHHAKTEKFLVIRGQARFRFRHVETGATFETTVRGGDGRIVETVPGWTHNIANTGIDELVVMLWANEILDRSRPDTYPMKVIP